jgi:hypothetical protein
LDWTVGCVVETLLLLFGMAKAAHGQGEAGMACMSCLQRLAAPANAWQRLEWHSAAGAVALCIGPLELQPVELERCMAQVKVGSSWACLLGPLGPALPAAV